MFSLRAYILMIFGVFKIGISNFLRLSPYKSFPTPIRLPRMPPQFPKHSKTKQKHAKPIEKQRKTIKNLPKPGF